MAFSPNKLSTKEADRLGLPEGFALYPCAMTGGINLTDDRSAIDDGEFFLLENMLRIGKNNYRTLWDRGTNIYTAPSGRTIISFFWFSIGLTLYCAIFLSDGTAIQIDVNGVETVISSVPGTFYTTGPTLPACAQWGVQFLLISNNFAQNNYWAWDGRVLYQAGTISPIIDILSGGTGYTSLPTVVAIGGSGSGIVVVPEIVNGSIVSFVITNPGTGYLPGDVVQFSFSGGGSDTSPILQAVLASSAVQVIEVVNGGSGYQSAPAVTILGGGGSGATATSTLTSSGGSVSSVAVISGGQNYTSTPTVLFSASGGGASATATISGGSLTSVAVTAGGSGYLSAPNVTVSGVGTGAFVTATINQGQVSSVAVVTGGTGYTSATTSLIFATGGSGAQAVAILTPGTVNAVNVINGGSGFTGTPTITFEGGGGAGATATAIMSAGSIFSVTLTSGGFDYTSSPEVIVSAGLNNSASAQAALMPFIVSGAAIETFQDRVWLFNPFSPVSQQTGGNILTSAPDSMSDFATSDGGSIFVANEPFLRQQYYAGRQAQGYLYTFADSAVDVISNVQTTGTPTTTTFNYQNVDPQEGTQWRDTCQYYGLSVLYDNPTGRYGLYGGAVKNISRPKLTNLYDNALFPPAAGAVTPSSAIANLHTIKTELTLMTITDPITGLPRTIMTAWDETDWFLTSQTTSLTYIGTQGVNSAYTAYGTDGRSLFPLFATPSAALTKRLSTKLFGGNSFPFVKISDGLWFLGDDLSANAAGIVFNVTIDSEYGFYTDPISPITFHGPVAAGETGDIYGSLLGISITTTSPDFVLKYIAIGYETVWGGYGDPPNTAQTI